MILEFTSISIENFKSFGLAQHLDLMQCGPGLHFLRGVNKDEPALGANGAAKSSLWDALCWCLYGRTPDGSRNPDIKPWYGDKHTSVTVRMKVDGARHTIQRTTFPNTLTHNGKACAQEDVDQLIGMGLVMFVNTILLAQGQPLFFDLEPSKKMALFSEALNLDRWDSRATAAGALASELERELATWEGELSGHDRLAAELEELYQKAQAGVRLWESQREERVTKLEQDIAVSELVLKAVEKDAGKADLAYDGAATELRQIERDLQSLADKVREEQLAYDRAAQKAAAFERQARDAERDLEELGDTEVCPTCGQSLTGTGRKKHATELKASIKEYRALAAKARPEKKISVAAKAYEAARVSRDDFLQRVNKARDLQDSLNKRLAEERAKFKVLKQQLATWEEEGNPFRKQLTDLRKQKKDIAADKAALEKQIKGRQARILRTKFWVKGFRDVRLLHIEDVLHELELTTAGMLAEVGLVDWAVHYDVQRETKAGTAAHGLNVVITSPRHKTPVRWESFSGGEGQRLRIVGALALSEVLLAHANVHPNLEILDEPTQHLSREGSRDLIGYLAARAGMLKKQIWYVDHLATESTLFDSVLTVTKTKKGNSVLG